MKQTSPVVISAVVLGLILCIITFFLGTYPPISHAGYLNSFCVLCYILAAMSMGYALGFSQATRDKKNRL